MDYAPLTGNAFIIDAAKVNAFLMKLIADNPVAEQKVLPQKDGNNGRVSYKALQDHYERVGSNAKALIKAEKDLNDLFYTGEKRPRMWWDEFEVRLTNAFATIDKDAGRAIYTDDGKLRKLNQKIRADFLVTMKSQVQMEMTKVPSSMNYNLALSNYRNVVNDKFPHQETSSSRTKRRIQNVNNNQSGNNKGEGVQVTEDEMAILVMVTEKEGTML